jgi:hypothetical protein
VGVDRNRALRNLRFKITRLLLAFMVRPLIFGLTDKVDAFFTDQRSVTLIPRIGLGAETAPANGTGCKVVDRYHPAQYGGTLKVFFGFSLFPDCAGLICVRQN